jgi:RNA polymerase sigma-70 factor (family 1)
VSTAAIDFENVLLQQIAAGDEIAFGNLFHAWRDKLYFYILRITNSSETAEDVLQDVFCKLWIKRDDLSEVNNFGAYLFRMAHNHAISGMRRMAQETIILSELRREALSSGLPIDETLLCKQVQEKLKQIVDQLPRQQRLVYTLSREQGLKQEEIALQLDITVSTVQNHMTQALRNIRKQLSHFFPEVAYQIIIAFTILIAY